MNQARLLDALDFAAEKHKGQRREDAGASPYINHPIAVARLLAVIGGVTCEDIILAAVLHDTIEDTSATPEELLERFGEAVTAIVLEVTDDKKLDKADRKRLQIEHAPQISPGARQVKIADKTANLTDLAADPPDGWSTERKREYVEWSAKVVEGCRGVNAQLESAFDDAMRRARQALLD